MKTSLTPAIIMAVFMTSGILASGQVVPQNRVMRDASTHEELSAKLRMAEQEDPMKNMKPAVGEDPSVAHKSIGILEGSDILCVGSFATLVPKQAILQMPKNYKDRLGYRQGVKIQTWPDFFGANRSWITTIEVSRDQAEGKEPLTEQTQTQMVKTGNLIVATFQGAPISVLPLKVPVETNPAVVKP